MDEFHKKILQKNHRHLVNDLDLKQSSVLDTLREDGMISSNEEDVILSEKSRRNQNTKLLNYLKKRDPAKNPYDSFKRALDSEYRFLVEKLSNCESEVDKSRKSQHVSRQCTHCALAKNLIPPDVSHSLYENGILTDDDLDDLNNDNVPRNDRVKRLLDLLKAKHDQQETVTQFNDSLKVKYNYLVLEEDASRGMAPYLECKCGPKSNTARNIDNEVNLEKNNESIINVENDLSKDDTDILTKSDKNNNHPTNERASAENTLPSSTGQQQLSRNVISSQNESTWIPLTNERTSPVSLDDNVTSGTQADEVIGTGSRSLCESSWTTISSEEINNSDITSSSLSSNSCVAFAKAANGSASKTKACVPTNSKASNLEGQGSWVPLTKTEDNGCKQADTSEAVSACDDFRPTASAKQGSWTALTTVADMDLLRTQNELSNNNIGRANTSAGLRNNVKHGTSNKSNNTDVDQTSTSNHSSHTAPRSFCESSWVSSSSQSSHAAKSPSESSWVSSSSQSSHVPRSLFESSWVSSKEISTEDNLIVSSESAISHNTAGVRSITESSWTSSNENELSTDTESVDIARASKHLRESNQSNDLIKSSSFLPDGQWTAAIGGNGSVCSDCLLSKWHSEKLSNEKLAAVDFTSRGRTYVDVVHPTNETSERRDNTSSQLANENEMAPNCIRNNETFSSPTSIRTKIMLSSSHGNALSGNESCEDNTRVPGCDNGKDQCLCCAANGDVLQGVLKNACENNWSEAADETVAADNCDVPDTFDPSFHLGMLLSQVSKNFDTQPGRDIVDPSLNGLRMFNLQPVSDLNRLPSSLATNSLGRLMDISRGDELISSLLTVELMEGRSNAVSMAPGHLIQRRISSSSECGPEMFVSQAQIMTSKTEHLGHLLRNKKKVKRKRSKQNHAAGACTNDNYGCDCVDGDTKPVDITAKLEGDDDDGAGISQAVAKVTLADKGASGGACAAPLESTEPISLGMPIFKALPNNKKLMRRCSRLWDQLFFLREKGDWDTFSVVTQTAFDRFSKYPDILVLLYRSEMCVSTFYKNDQAKALEMFDKAIEQLPKTEMPNWHLARILPLKVELCTRCKMFEEASNLLEDAKQAMQSLGPCLSTGAVYFFEAIYLGNILQCTRSDTKSAEGIAEKVKKCFLTAIEHYQQEDTFAIKSFLNQVYLFLALFSLGLDCKKITYIESQSIKREDISLAEHYLNLFENNCWEDSTNWSRMLFYIGRGEQHKQMHNIERSLDYFKQALECSKAGKFKEHDAFIENNIDVVSKKVEEQVKLQALRNNAQSVEDILRKVLDSSSESGSSPDN